MAAEPTVRSAKCFGLSRAFFTRLVVGVLCLWLASCAAAPLSPRIALLAPFEGRYREIGYDALYAARLALYDTQVDLLPVDDGGSAENAADRARALARDPQVLAVLALGYAATDPAALAAFDDVPVVVIGDWGARPATERVFILSNPAIAEQLTIPARIDILEAAALDAPFTGGEVLGLNQLADLRPSLDGISVISSANLPVSPFREQYRSDSFAGEPGLLASLTYDAAGMAAQAIHGNQRRAGVYESLNSLSFQGLNGTIRFLGGFWVNAPIHTFSYTADGSLAPVDDIVE